MDGHHERLFSIQLVHDPGCGIIGRITTMPLTTGSRLGAHEIIGFLGAGGMGEVYVALDTKLGRRVAIKVLPEAQAHDPERVARLHREAQAVAAVNHAGIAAIYDFAEARVAGSALADVVHYLVLELVEGETLADRLGRGALPVEEALQLAKQILEALEAAHEKGICHRDLKPANIKITPDGTVKVLDFGLAKFLQTGPAMAGLTHSPTLSLAATFPGVVLGTAGYMSPEQAKGFEADQRSDVFAFGCILYEMLTGQQAFAGETVSEILASVLKSEVDFTALPARLNPRLVETLTRCLEKNPKKRWQAIGDVRLEIEALIGRGVVAPAEPRAVEARPATRWKAAAAIAAATVVGGAVAGYAAWRAKPEPARIVTRFTVPLGEGQGFTGMGRRSVALSPDGTNLAYVANNRVYLRSMSGLTANVIAGSEDLVGVTSPVFSPDGKSIVFYSSTDRALKRLAITGGAPSTICQQLPVPVFGMSWNEYGIVFGQTGKGIFRVAANGGNPELIAPVDPDEMASSPQILPGGRTVLFSVKKTNVSWDKAAIVVQPLGGGERKPLVPGASDGRYLPTGHLIYASALTMFAVPFDVRALKVTGGPSPVVERVRRSGSNLFDDVTHLSFSENGSLAYIPGPSSAQGEVADLAFFDRQGGVQPLKLPPGRYSSPRVSPDGKRVAYERNDEKETSIWTYDTTGGGAPQQLTVGRAPVWSPDGQWIAFQSDREGDSAIFRARADASSGTPDRLTRPDEHVLHTPQSWSRDGVLLFSAQKGNESHLWTISMDDRKPTGERKAMPYGDMVTREATFSPDGRWIAYQTVGPATPTVDASLPAVALTYLAPFPWTGEFHLVPFEGTAGHPFWSPGNEIIVNHTGSSNLAIAVKTAPSVSFGRPSDFPRRGRSEPNPLLERRNVDMMPDDKRVVGVLDPGTASPAGGERAAEITVVLNWFDEVRQRVTAK